MDLTHRILSMEGFNTMKTKQNLLKDLISWSILALISTGIIVQLNRLFVPKYTYQNTPWATTNTYNGFYKMKKNTVDVIFLGSSVAANAWCPQEIYNDYGIRSYNLASEQQSIFLSYYWLKEALRYQNPKVVVLDLRFLLTRNSENPLNTTEGLVRKCLDPMRLSPVKLEAAIDIGNRCPDQSAMSFLLTNIRFHTRWDSGLEDLDFRKDLWSDAELKGWDTMLYQPDEETLSYQPFVREKDDDNENCSVNDLQEEYLCKIGDLCKQNKIQLILMNLPGNTEPSKYPSVMTTGYDNFSRHIAEKIGADYYNLGEEDTYKTIYTPNSNESLVGHSNYWGSVKLSQYTGKLLQSYSVPLVTDDQYEKTRKFYAYVAKNANMQYITDFDQYLDAINDKNYTLFFSISDEGSKSIGEKEMEKLRLLGIRTDLRGKYRNSWYAIVDPIKGVTEELSPNLKIEHFGVFGDAEIKYYIASAGYNTNASMSSINIAGIEYSHQTRGINIVVWDNVGRTVIDSVTFDTCDQAQASRNWFTEMEDRGMDPTFNTRW